MLVGILGILGDLFESFIKRCFNRKDLADFFPGWGGLMDRIDSIIFAVPAVFYYLVIFHNAELNAPWCPSSQVEIISWISELMRLS